MVTAETEASWCCATMKTGDGYLRGAGAGGPDPGGELVVENICVEVTALVCRVKNRNGIWSLFWGQNERLSENTLFQTGCLDYN